MYHIYLLNYSVLVHILILRELFYFTNFIKLV
jgi:hypothetical protein